jgi:hypothetical protein
MHKILGVKYVKGYSLEIIFENQISKQVDFSERINEGGIFEPLREVKYFQQVILNKECHCIEWPNGADVCPDTLFEQGQLSVASNGA